MTLMTLSEIRMRSVPTDDPTPEFPHASSHPPAARFYLVSLAERV